MALFTTAVCSLLIIFVAELALPDPPERLLPEYHREMNFRFDEPVDANNLCFRIEELVNDGTVRSAYLLGASSHDEKTVIVGVYEGYTDGMTITRNSLHTLHTLDNISGYTAYIDQALIPLDYSFRINELPVYINGILVRCCGMSPDIRFYTETFKPYLEMIPSNAVSIAQQPASIQFDRLGIHETSDDVEIASAYTYIYLPLEQFVRLGLQANCLSIVYMDEITDLNDAIVDFLMDGYAFETVDNEYLSSQEKVLEDSVLSVTSASFMIVLLLCVLSINELVFIDQIVSNFQYVIQNMRLLGVRNSTQIILMFTLLFFVFSVGCFFSLIVFIPLRQLMTWIGFFSFADATNCLVSGVGFLIFISAWLLYFVIKTVIGMRRW